MIARIRDFAAKPGGFGIVVGSSMFLFLAIVGFVSPLFLPYRYDELVGEGLEAPSLKHPMGLDQLGRDVLTRVLAAVPADIGIAFLGVSFPLIIGTLVGILLALSKNKVAVSVVRSIIDGINAFPLLIIAIAMVSILGPGLFNVVIILTLLNWARYARIARTRAILVLNENYIEAARLLGYSRKRIVLRHVMPNVTSESLAYALSDFILVIVIVSGLSFLGLGARPPAAEWGAMIADGRIFLNEAWWLTVFPGLALCWAAIALSLMVEGLSRRNNWIN